MKRKGSPWRLVTHQAAQVVRRKRLLAFVFILLCALSFFTAVPALPHFRLGTSKYVVILGANKGGGVLQKKTAREWDLERLSIANKKDYVLRHGYHLAIKDMTAKKRYTHEWRESWEKVDIIRETMKQFPDAEWFWWLDLESYIMQPERSLESHVFSRLDRYPRNVSYFNPAGFDLDLSYVDESQPIDLLLTQDCGGFSMGSFFIRRSPWTELLLDVWWDPVFYEEKHMEWIHGEQAALEYLYSTQAWVRSHVGFAELRRFNAYPPGACSDFEGVSDFFYNRQDKDFVVNMAGCQWGRDCWGEMREFKQIAEKIHQKRFILF